VRPVAAAGVDCCATRTPSPSSTTGDDFATGCERDARSRPMTRRTSVRCTGRPVLPVQLDLRPARCRRGEVRSWSTVVPRRFRRPRSDSGAADRRRPQVS
jgi:hypothetical protein